MMQKKKKVAGIFNSKSEFKSRNLGFNLVLAQTFFPLHLSVLPFISSVGKVFNLEWDENQLYVSYFLYFKPAVPWACASFFLVAVSFL